MTGLTGVKGANAAACESWRKREDGVAGCHNDAQRSKMKVN